MQDVTAEGAIGGIQLSWVSNSVDTSAVLGQRIQYSSDGHVWRSILLDQFATSYFFETSEGYEYSFRIAELNEVGFSRWSIPTGFVGATLTSNWSVSGAPENLVAALEPNGLSLTWDSGSVISNLPILGYRIEWSDDSVNWNAEIVNTRSLNTSFKFVLEPTGKTQFFFRVAAVTAGRLSDYSDHVKLELF